MLPVVLALLFSVVIMYSSAQQASIISSPQSVNISIDDHAVFNCTAIATYINWNINGEALNANLMSRGFEQQHDIVIDDSQSLRMGSLRILGSLENNNINIECVVLLQLSSLMFLGNKSDPALLLVQGLLEAVNDLTAVSVNSTTVLISWSPPFTLKGVPILGYNVTINNTTSGENETMSVEGDATLLYYSINHPDPDNNFTVTVVPINVVGPGENVTILFSAAIPVSSPTSTYTSLPSLMKEISTPTVFITVSVNLTRTHGPTTTFTSSPDSPGGVENIVTAVISVLMVLSVLILVALVLSLCIWHHKKSISRDQEKGKLKSSSTVQFDSKTSQAYIIPRGRSDIPSALSDTNGARSATDLQPNEPAYDKLAHIQSKHFGQQSAQEKIYANTGNQKRQANIYIVPIIEDIAPIVQRVAHKWRLIGLELGADSAELDQIASEYGNDQSLCCYELFRKWSVGEITASCPFTWKGVIETLDSKSVRESSLARSLESTCL